MKYRLSQRLWLIISIFTHCKCLQTTKCHKFNIISISIINKSKIFFYLCVRNRNTLLQDIEKDNQRHIQDCTITIARRTDTLLDVSRLRLWAGGAGVAARDELELDASLISLRNHGESISRLALAPHPQPHGRKSSHIDKHQLHFSILCREPGDTTHRRAHPLWCAAPLRWGVVSKGIRHSGDGASHRLTAGDADSLAHLRHAG